MFGALDTATTGVNLARTWIDAISDNVANVNTVRPADEEPFRARLVVARPIDGPQGAAGQGVAVAGIALRNGEAQLEHDPSHPMANEDGVVKRPVVDLAQQMTDMLLAQRLYQANISVLRQARDAYQSALQIGRR